MEGVAYHTTDITERLEAAEKEWLARSALYEMSWAGLFRDAREEIERLREELKKEMFNSHIAEKKGRRK